MKWFRRKEPTPEGPDRGDEPKRDIEDISQEVQSVLTLRRWEKRDEPFEGFGSQPGKF